MTKKNTRLDKRQLAMKLKNTHIRNKKPNGFHNENQSNNNKGANKW